MALARGRRRALQGRGVRVDAAAPCRSSRSGSTRRRAATATPRGAARPLPAAARDDADRRRSSSARENAPAIALYESIGMSEGARVPERPASEAPAEAPDRVAVWLLPLGAGELAAYAGRHWRAPGLPRSTCPRAASPTAPESIYPVSLELLERIESHIRRHELIEPGGDVLCLVSGGADSTCLFHALRELGYAVSALHVDHGLRGAESDEDARWCAERFGAEVVQARRALRDRGRAARRALLVPRRPPARDRPHALRPGRDDPLPARRRAARRRGSRCAARTASCARCSACWREETEAYCRERGLAWRDRLVEPRHAARPDPPRDPAAAPAAPSGRARERPARARRAADDAAGARRAARRAGRVEARRPRRRRAGGARARPSLARAGAGRAARRGRVGAVADRVRAARA